MAIKAIDFYNELSKIGVEFFTGVPDSLLKEFCLCIDDQVPEKRHIIAANEGNAIALASRRTFNALSTAPAMGTPKCPSNVSGVFAPMKATVSPLPIPIFNRAEAGQNHIGFTKGDRMRLS